MRRRSLLAALPAAALMPAARAQPAGLPAGITVTWGEDDNAARTYDPRVTQSRHESQVIVQVFDTLIASDEDNALHPGLARSWAVAPDGRSITLQLRDDVTFHDGTRFDADAVRFTYDSVVDPKLGSQGAVDILGPYAGCDVLGPFEVRINYKRPFGAAAASLSQNELSVVSPTAVRTLGDAGFAKAPVGTGPFRFTLWEPSRQVVLERNEDYRWAPPFFKRQGPSRVARIVHRFIPDASTRIAALEAGEIDIADLTPVLDMQRLGEDRGYRTLVGEATGLPFGVLINTSRGVFADKRVRQAFALCIDRARLTDDLFFGLVKPAYGPLSRSTPAYWPGVEAMGRPDPKRAAALLDEAGWAPGPGGIRMKDGKPLAADYFAPPPLEPDTAVAIQAEARRVGFDLHVETITFARNTELVFANAYDILPLRWISADPSLLEIPFHSRNIPRPGYYKFNWPRVADPELDALLEQGAGAADPAERNRLYADAQRRIMDSAVWLPVHDQVNTLAWRADKTGYRLARTRWMVRFHDVEPA